MGLKEKHIVLCVRLESLPSFSNKKTTINLQRRFLFFRFLSMLQVDCFPFLMVVAFVLKKSTFNTFILASALFFVFASTMLQVDCHLCFQTKNNNYQHLTSTCLHFGCLLMSPFCWLAVYSCMIFFITCALQRGACYIFI